MLVDHFTKPLKGKLSRRFRAEIMNIPYHADIADMGWDSIKMKKGVTWKLHEETNPAFPHECVGKYTSANPKDDKRATSDKGKTGSVLLDRA